MNQTMKRRTRALSLRPFPQTPLFHNGLMVAASALLSNQTTFQQQPRHIASKKRVVRMACSISSRAFPPTLNKFLRPGRLWLKGILSSCT